VRAFPLYRYVGPRELAVAARGRSGARIGSRADLVEAHRRLGGRREALVCTYVVDDLGVLRIADRASEHVDCASGGPVLAAGELTIEPDGTISATTNLSTGFCPPASSWAALDHALRATGQALDGWSHAFEFRRCACGARVVVKDDETCPECDRVLPTDWSFERASVQRGRVFLEDACWRVDVIEEASSRGQDRTLALHDPRTGDAGLLVVIADGVGGVGGGREAAESLVDAVGRDRPSTVPAMQACAAVLRGPGQAAFVVARLRSNGSVVGVARGDTLLLAHAGGGWHELTEGQPRSHDARPAPFALAGCDALFACSDGIWKYVDRRVLEAMLDSDDAELPWRLVDAVRTRSGRLYDDVSAVFARRA
jgi:hypothetical protein